VHCTGCAMCWEPSKKVYTAPYLRSDCHINNHTHNHSSHSANCMEWNWSRSLASLFSSTFCALRAQSALIFLPHSSLARGNQLAWRTHSHNIRPRRWTTFSTGRTFSPTSRAQFSRWPALLGQYSLFVAYKKGNLIQKLCSPLRAATCWLFLWTTSRRWLLTSAMRAPIRLSAACSACCSLTPCFRVSIIC
jgi:hypothetical protein